MVMAQMEVEQGRWNWAEALMERIPANYLLVSYILFILLFSIYYLFSRKVILFEWQNNTWYVSQSLAKSFLISFLIAGLIYLSEKTRETYKYIDLLNGNLTNDYFARIEARVIGEKFYHLLLLFSVVAPFITMSWGQWPYYNWESDNIWALGLDIYNYLLSILILALLTELLWLITNIIRSINEIGCASSAFSTAIDVFGISMKLRPLRNFFLIFIVYYFIAIALVIYTYMSPSSKMSIEPIYFMVLLVIGGLLFVAGLEAIQRIIDCRVENELDILNNRKKEQDHRLVEVVSSGNFRENAIEIEYISNVLEVIEKKRDSLLQVNRRAYDVTSVGLFISSFLIPLLTLLRLIHK
jgi:hypothetical protein